MRNGQAALLKPSARVSLPDAILGGLLIKWHRADDPTMVLVGGAVSSWPDKVAVNPMTDVGNAARRPTFEAAGINGQASVLFDGVNNALFAQDPTFLTAGTRPWFWLVGQWVTPPPDVAAAADYWFGWYDNNGTVTQGLFGLWDDNRQETFWGYYSGASSSPLGWRRGEADTVAHTVAVTMENTGSLVAIDGDDQTIWNENALAVAAMANNANSFTIGGDNAGNNRANYRLAEILACSAKPSAAQISQLQRYARQRYATVFGPPGGDGKLLLIAGQSNGQLMGDSVNYTHWPISKKKNYLRNISGYTGNARGSTSLAVNWDPADTDGLHLVSTLIASLDTAVVSPECAIVWWQGENDADDQTAYYNNFIRLKNAIEAVRPDVLWIIIKGHPAGGVPPGVRAAEVQLAADFANIELIVIDDLVAPYDGLHFRGSQYVTVMGRVITTCQTYFSDPSW